MGLSHWTFFILFLSFWSHFKMLRGYFWLFTQGSFLVMLRMHKGC